MGQLIESGKKSFGLFETELPICMYWHYLDANGNKAVILRNIETQEVTISADFRDGGIYSGTKKTLEVMEVKGYCLIEINEPDHVTKIIRFFQGELENARVYTREFAVMLIDQARRMSWNVSSHYSQRRV